MPERLLKLDDISTMNSAPNVADVFKKLGYNVLQTAQPLSVKDLDLPSRSAEAIWDAHLIADHQKGNDSLQVLLFQLHEQEWESISVASNRMRAIAQGLYRRPSDFLLIGTRENYNQLMLVNPRKSFDAQMNLKAGIRKLLIDRRRPTAYDRDRLEAISAHNLDPKAIYEKQKEAFNVDKLTNEFYRGYKKIFEHVRSVIQEKNKHPYFDDDSRLHQFTQRLLGRVMFLYFLQKKEFLGGDRDFLRNQYRRLKTEPEEGDFYSRLLEPLFFEMLNKQRPDFESPWGKIPYLNGGLFDRDYGEDVIDAAGVKTPEFLTLPNSLFDPSGDQSVLKFFNSYNFTVSENVQGDEDVAVDPEMLGKVFENLLAADERGASGTFYTPRGIVHFMCVESLSRYLADESGLDLEVVKRLAEYETEMPDDELRKLLSTEQTKKLKQALESVKVCDPAVGSGAFPLGMMQVILSVWQAIRQREGESLKRGSLAMSRLKRNIIANNLYGVDIKPEAIEIAKLRMWLSMVVDIPTIDDVEPLPNLDYKLMAGNSLISSIAGEQLVPDPTKDTQLTITAVNPVAQEIQKLVALQQRYFLAHADERKELRSQILEAEKTVFQAAIVKCRQSSETEQRKLQQDIKLMKKASKSQTQKLQTIEGKLKELDSAASDVERGLRSLDFFQWHLHFNDVFREKGGFDVVIGNPPYVRQEQIKSLKPLLQEEYECYTGTADLFVYFFERGFRLLKPHGNLTFICSNKFMRSGYGEKLRKLLGSEGSIHYLIDFGDAPVFEAIAYPSIVQVARTSPNEHQVRSLSWDPEKPVDEFVSVFRSSSFLITQRELTPAGWRLESPSTLRLMEKLKAAGMPLGEYIRGRFYRGVVTGFNDAFVVDRATRDQLITEHPSSAEVLKPYLRGRDVKRWCIEPQDLWLIFTRRGIKIEQYPAIKKYLEQFKERLSPGIPGGRKAGSYAWYEIQDNIAYWQEFAGSKIIYPDIAKKCDFALDSQGLFPDCTLFIIPEGSLSLLGILNSKIVQHHFSQICPKVRGDFMRFKSIYVSQIPIPDMTKTEKIRIETLVEQRLQPSHQAELLEAEINDRVAHLYGLNIAEIQQINELI